MADRHPDPVGDMALVGIGASAGGLDACRQFLRALPAGHGMSFILVQHLDPTHDSMMAELLAGHTTMAVFEATDHMPIEPEHLYVIPPGAYLSIGDGALRLSPPQARHGTRLPFDFLLHSLAEACGSRAMAVILSGTGADGSSGLRAVKAAGGLVIAQDPDEAAYDGMPRSAIATGAVDQVLPVAEIGAALVAFARHAFAGPPAERAGLRAGLADRVPDIIDLLRMTTVHDFTQYKRGTVQRRIERRMGMAGIEADDAERYVTLLRTDTDELEHLAKDLLINVTGFFRDPKVFDVLAETVLPDLVARQPPDEPLRLWVAGCSSGEEAYSLVMLLREAIGAAQRSVKLQVFASDVDADAVAEAREGLYPDTIAAEVSPARLARFFSKEAHGYQVLPELRAQVVFAVQDVLTDPPFSRLDMVSCRNLLIYLRPEAQAKAVSVFHFALREGGVLLLGTSETIGTVENRFEVISKAARLFRRIGHSRPEGFGFAPGSGDMLRATARTGMRPAPSRQAVLADLCRRLVMESFAPAAVLVNRGGECLYFLGPTERYLRVAPGLPTHDLLSMARHDLRLKLRLAIQRAIDENGRIVTEGGRTAGAGPSSRFDIDIQPVASEGEEFLLVCFVDRPEREVEPGSAAPSAESPSPDGSRLATLERELVATRAELQAALRNLEILTEEQKAINEEALSVNEEYQSTNEELLTSKEELQSLNEELTALNSQLQETLERQRTTANDLENVLCSTDVATLFLDTHFNIRFFTPATVSLFSIIPADIGRPLADLRPLAADDALLAEAEMVLRTLKPAEREIEAQSGAWFVRRILPYRTREDGVEGVVITFADITERRRISDALEAAEHAAQLANRAKSRFLAAASHDLRQPLQTLTLLQGLLARTVDGDRARKLVSRFDETVGAMSGMLDTLLDINNIDAGTIRPEPVSIPINGLLVRLADEFSYQAQVQDLILRVVPCGLCIDTDPRLLEQMLRNLLSNALKYTREGRILLGCRRHADRLSIEVWDTGIGIAETELGAVFEEYHQLDNPARESSRGLGLGLSIVQRLGTLLDHRVTVRSQPGKGSVFTIEVKLRPDGHASPPPPPDLGATAPMAEPGGPRVGVILVVEDDPALRGLLDVMLTEEGHVTATAPDGSAALKLVTDRALRPELVLSDYNLPHGMDGLQLALKLRQSLRHPVPVIILTGDISVAAAADIARGGCTHLNKPVKATDLHRAIRHLLGPPPPVCPAPAERPRDTGDIPVIHVVDDDASLRQTLRGVLEEAGLAVRDYGTGEDFLDAYRPGGAASCLLIDAYLPGMSGLELLRRVKAAEPRLAAIMITGRSDVPMAVQAMKDRAFDFIDKPVAREDLLASVSRALDQARDATKASAWREDATRHLATLTSRQREIMDMVLAGHPSKNIAADLGISQRTVENHRASIMRKTGTRSLPALARLVLAAVREEGN